jgi:hypothetical protein
MRLVKEVTAQVPPPGSAAPPLAGGGAEPGQLRPTSRAPPLYARFSSTLRF